MLGPGRRPGALGSVAEWAPWTGCAAWLSCCASDHILSCWGTCPRAVILRGYFRRVFHCVAQLAMFHHERLQVRVRGRHTATVLSSRPKRARQLERIHCISLHSVVAAFKPRTPPTVELCGKWTQSRPHCSRRPCRRQECGFRVQTPVSFTGPLSKPFCLYLRPPLILRRYHELPSSTTCAEASGAYAGLWKHLGASASAEKPHTPHLAGLRLLLGASAPVPEHHRMSR